jgi:hypothetical protein
VLDVCLAQYFLDYFLLDTRDFCRLGTKITEANEIWHVIVVKLCTSFVVGDLSVMLRLAFARFAFDVSKVGNRVVSQIRRTISPKLGSASGARR